MNPKKGVNDLQQQVSKLLKDKPELKKAMDVFGIGMKEYTKAISALTRKNVIITSINTNGDMAGN
ncbi:MAG: hypothetical protein Q8P88_00315 [Candidatus Jorgensenbacteria bacterium]|nr:hypothetical protein [Candidatus Jorgensenbacteria bacterium]